MKFFDTLKALFGFAKVDKNHKDWYYYTKIYSKKIVFFYNLYEKRILNNEVEQNTTFLLPQNLLFGTNSNTIIELLGQPKCLFDNQKRDQNIKTIFYKIKHFDQQVLMQLQFYNDVLFFVGIDTGSALFDSNDKNEKLITFLPNLIVESNSLKGTTPLFADVNGNFLIIEDDVNTCINYFSNVFTGNNIKKFEEAIKAEEKPILRKKRRK